MDGRPARLERQLGRYDRLVHARVVIFAATPDRVSDAVRAPVCAAKATSGHIAPVGGSKALEVGVIRSCPFLAAEGLNDEPPAGPKVPFGTL